MATTTTKRKPTPKCVLISDVHFNLKNLKEATASLKFALEKAQELEVPLIIAGDLNDTKAIMRAECVNAILGVLWEKRNEDRVIVLVGNHDLVNEKSAEHSLNFLRPLCEVVETKTYDRWLDLWFMPYYADADRLCADLRAIPEGSTVIAHQGFRGAHMGEYVVDKTSIDTSEVAHLRVITGHYHRRQTIGTVTYLGTPYTVSFHEANDGPKGINILWNDGELELIPIGLRRHEVIECPVSGLKGLEPVPSDTILKVKVTGPVSELARINKKALGESLLGHGNFQLEKIAEKSEVEERSLAKRSRAEMLDDVIARSEETPERKKFLKNLWREIADETA